MVRHVARMEGSRSAFKILTGKPTGKRPLERLRSRWADNIRVDLAVRPGYAPVAYLMKEMRLNLRFRNKITSIIAI